MAAVSVGEKCTRTNRIANTACVYFFFNDLSNHESLPWHPQMYINPPPHKTATRKSCARSTRPVWFGGRREKVVEMMYKKWQYNKQTYIYHCHFFKYIFSHPFDHQRALKGTARLHTMPSMTVGRGGKKKKHTIRSTRHPILNQKRC